MGNQISKLFSLFSQKEPKEITMIGLDGAGKTTILYKLMSVKKDMEIIPTIGFNVESVTIDGVTFNCWDLGGQHRIRGMWSHYIKGCHGIVFVVDIEDKDRWEEAKNSLFESLSHCGSKTPVLILANKVDNPGDPDVPLEIKKLVKALELPSLDTEWKCVNICSIENEYVSEPLIEIYKSFQWLVSAIKRV